MRPMSRTLAAAVLVAAVWLAPPAAHAAGTASAGAAGAGSAVCSLVYVPVKLVYATGGVVLSGLAWLWTWGDTDVAGPILRGATGGDYVVQPAHLRGDEKLVFHAR